jgi:hypothetical protein
MAFTCVLQQGEAAAAAAEKYTRAQAMLQHMLHCLHIKVGGELSGLHLWYE